MKVPKEITVYCPYCKKHTLHTVKIYSKKPERWLNIGRRRHERAIKGHVGSVEPKAHSKKLGKKQKTILTCTVCHKSIERVFGRRTKKKIEIKR
ncbi:MAG: 50S ribosomal protein L44e [Candidatus Micrarchaeia archaeon]